MFASTASCPRGARAGSSPSSAWDMEPSGNVAIKWATRKRTTTEAHARGVVAADVIRHTVTEYLDLDMAEPAGARSGNVPIAHHRGRNLSGCE